MRIVGPSLSFEVCDLVYVMGWRCILSNPSPLERAWWWCVEYVFQ